MFIIYFNYMKEWYKYINFNLYF